MSPSARLALRQQLFPSGIPKLWCPTLSFFSSAGQFDSSRIGEHMQRLAPHVRGLLVPGSTGEGWEMSDAQIQQLLEIVLPLAAQMDMRVLIGILKTETDQVLETINQLSSAIQAPATVGITVCAAKGPDKSQTEIQSGLARILQLGIPTALYQLPQVTQNELSSETFTNLAAEFPNFFMFKDTSGEDRVANSLADHQGVFMVRGSEKDGYAKWLREAGGNYDGFLLSTANCFAGQLNQIIQASTAGDRAEAVRLSNEISRSVSRAFEVASRFSVGNAFTNANKAIDHLARHGTAFREFDGPMLISGTRLPLAMLEELAGLIDGTF